MVNRWNGQIVEIVTEVFIHLARAYLGLNRLKGGQEPADRCYLTPECKPSGEAGARRIAQLFRELEYEPCAQNGGYP